MKFYSGLIAYVTCPLFSISFLFFFAFVCIYMTMHMGFPEGFWRGWRERICGEKKRESRYEKKHAVELESIES